MKPTPGWKLQKIRCRTFNFTLSKPSLTRLPYPAMHQPLGFHRTIPKLPAYFKSVLVILIVAEANQSLAAVASEGQLTPPQSRAHCSRRRCRSKRLSEAGEFSRPGRPRRRAF
eukprot:scaffold388_cov244-Pinguiococcus_pyrenoidosus.AAC.1